MKGLIIRSPWIDMILKGEKTWELRGTSTKIRGKIALIKGGTKTVAGVCELSDVEGPLSKEDLIGSAGFHGLDEESLDGPPPYPKTYAWVLRNPVEFSDPVPYDHPQGAVIWVNLSSEESEKALDKERSSR